MIVVWILWLAVMLMSDGTSIPRGLSNCDCVDNSEECEKQCAIDTHTRRERQLHCSLDIIPPNSACDEGNSTYCYDNNRFVGASVNKECNSSDNRCTWLPCCFGEAECAMSPNYTTPTATAGSLKATNLTLTWSLVGGYLPKVLISWSQVLPVGAYQLFILTTDSEKYEDFRLYLDRCSCLNASIRHYSVEVGQYYNAHMQIKLVSLPIDQGIFDDDSHTVTRIVKVPDCWMLEGPYSDRCARVPSPPQNLTVVGKLVNESSVMLQISWRPPAYHTHSIIAYGIEIANSSDYSDNLFVYTDEAMSNYTIVMDRSDYTLWVSASDTNKQTVEPQTCYSVGKGRGIPSNYYCWGEQAVVALNIENGTSTSATTPSPTPISTAPTITNNGTQTATEAQPKATVLIATVSASGSLLLLITIVLILLVCRTYMYKRSQNYITLSEVSTPTPPPVTSAKVFIINSSHSSEEDLHMIRNLCHMLGKHSIESITYEYSMCDSGPERSGICQWVEDNFAKCDMTLFVCNKYFCDAWNRNDMDHHDDMVLAIKQLLHGHLQSTENNSKLAVVLLREHDRQYIPSLYLKNLTSFMVFSEGECEEEDLARYILQVPRFIGPAVITQHITLPENNV